MVCNYKAQGQKDWLLERGITPEKNPDKRKQQIREGVIDDR